MKVADVAKVALWLIVALIAFAVVKELLSVLLSPGLILVAFAIWWFGFRNKSSS